MTRDQSIAALLAQCAEDKDTQESPRGSNRGKRVEQMLRYTGLDGGYPWCAGAVAAWGIEALGKSWPAPRTADCDAILSWARRKNVLWKTDPLPGDIFLVLKSSTDAIHTGVVVKALANGRVQTWEGNTNDDGSREGYRVCNRTRATSNLVYVRWADTLADTSPAEETRLPETPAYAVWVSPYGLFPRVQMRSGRPCAPVRQLVASILSLSLENTQEIVGWSESSHTAVVRNISLAGTYTVSDGFGRSTAWAPVREIGEALGCVVSAGEMLDDKRTPTVSIGPAPSPGRTEL